MARTLLLHAIQEMEQAVTEVMNEHGDIPLPANMGPVYFDTAARTAGAVITLASSPQKFLTYSNILYAAQGLMEVIIR